MTAPSNARIRRFAGKALLACLVLATSPAAGHPGAGRVPNILFIVLDDLGVDQLTAFNPAAPTAALTPTLNAIAAKGVKFTNFYTMPECSPSRVAFFTGRHPFRTGVDAAILSEDLPAAQLSPFEITTPRVLETVGYRSAYIGKYHLGGPENNPDGIRAPVAAGGWHYFNGDLRGAPSSNDTTLGGQYTRDTQKYSCGFPLGTERGAAWFLGADNRPRCDDNRRAGYTGHDAVALGAIPALDAGGNLARTCDEAAGSGPDFTKLNGYYVRVEAVADAQNAQSTRSRKYSSTALTDAALAWIQSEAQRPGRDPWMATVGYHAIHTPYQPPPPDLYPPGFVWPAGIPQNCVDSAANRVNGQLMLAAVDREIGRLLVGLGLAQRSATGELVYRPEATDTMVVIAADNGTFLPIVQAPFDPSRSKGTPYETGARAPLIVSGPLVVAPGRTVEHLVNDVDLFRLFAEIADIDDVRDVVPASHILDSTSVLPYLLNPQLPTRRRLAFTQAGDGLKPASVIIWPCVVRAGPLSIATEVFTSQSICEANAGVWFGPTADRPVPPYPTSCAIKEAGLYPNLLILPHHVWAVRGERYKLVQVERPSCERNLGEYEFYDLTARSASNPAGIDLATADLLVNGQPTRLTSEQLAAFQSLQTQLQRLLDSEPRCSGDGNLDKQVDLDDIAGIARYRGQPSVFDFNRDGVTDVNDLVVVMDNFGRCR